MDPSNSSDSHLFHITLIVASRGEQSASDNELPASVQEALDDARGFLPFNSFEILDTAMVRSDGNARVRLRGANGLEYSAQLSFSREAKTGEFVVDRFAVVRLDKPSDGGGRPLGAGVAPRAPESPLTTSFRIRPGQTVLVGSSRIESGEQALVVLLSAAP